MRLKFDTIVFRSVIWQDEYNLTRQNITKSAKYRGILIYCREHNYKSLGSNNWSLRKTEYSLDLKFWVKDLILIQRITKAMGL